MPGISLEQRDYTLLRLSTQLSTDMEPEHMLHFSHTLVMLRWWQTLVSNNHFTRLNNELLAYAIYAQQHPRQHQELLEHFASHPVTQSNDVYDQKVWHFLQEVVAAPTQLNSESQIPPLKVKVEWNLSWDDMQSMLALLEAFSAGEIDKVHQYVRKNARNLTESFWLKLVHLTDTSAPEQTQTVLWMVWNHCRGQRLRLDRYTMFVELFFKRGLIEYVEDTRLLDACFTFSKDILTQRGMYYKKASPIHLQYEQAEAASHIERLTAHHQLLTQLIRVEKHFPASDITLHSNLASFVWQRNPDIAISFLEQLQQTTGNAWKVQNDNVAMLEGLIDTGREVTAAEQKVIEAALQSYLHSCIAETLDKSNIRSSSLLEHTNLARALYLCSYFYGWTRDEMLQNVSDIAVKLLPEDDATFDQVLGSYAFTCSFLVQFKQSRSGNRQVLQQHAPHLFSLLSDLHAAPHELDTATDFRESTHKMSFLYSFFEVIQQTELLAADELLVLAKEEIGVRLSHFLRASHHLLIALAKTQPHQALDLLVQILPQVQSDNFGHMRIQILSEALKQLGTATASSLETPNLSLEEQLFLELRYQWHLQFESAEKAQAKARADIEHVSALMTQLSRQNLSLPAAEQIEFSKFWQKNRGNISALYSFGYRRIKSITKYLVASSGFDLLEEKLATFAALDVELLEFLANYDFSGLQGSLDGSFYTKLLELAAGFQSLGKSSELVANLKKEGTIENRDALSFLRWLSQMLADNFVMSLGLNSVAGLQVTSEHIEYLPKIVYAIEAYPESSILLQAVVKADLLQEFQTILRTGEFSKERYSPQEQQALHSLVEYTQSVRETYKNRGIDFDAWLDCRLEEAFVVTPDDANTEQTMETFMDNLQRTLGRLQVDPAQLETPQELVDKLKQLVQKLRNSQTPVDQEALTDLENLVENDSKLLFAPPPTRSYHLGIRVWQRSALRDLLQGFFTHNCLALDSNNGQAIIGFLIDTMMQVIEVYDKDTGVTLGQTFGVFLLEQLTNNEDQVVMGLDNIELHRSVQPYGQVIREHLLAYVRALQQAVAPEVKTIYLNAGTVNDVPIADFHEESAQLQLLPSTGVPPFWERSYYEILDGWFRREEKWIKARVFAV